MASGDRPEKQKKEVHMISSISNMNSMTSMMQMRQQMFSRIDTNGDGKHDADELSAMVANGSQGGPGVEDILAEFDTDGDGSISESEFNAAQPGPPGAMSGANAMSTEDLIAQMFTQADENEDGVINEDELSQIVAMGPEDGPGAEKLLSQLDTNDDGTISETEFAEGPWANQQVQGPPPPPPPEEETGTESIFSQLDTDGDGTISEDEFDTAMNAIESFFSSISTSDSNTSVSDLMGLIGTALTAYQQAAGTSYAGSVATSQETGSSLYA
jgi:Ca2+-binding EF-hand superfamily protein